MERLRLLKVSSGIVADQRVYASSWLIMTSDCEKGVCA